ncbi:MAG: hydroxymethylbilane synthase [bacterium]
MKHKNQTQTIKIGTRGSKLAIWQANHVANLLQNYYPALKVEIIKIKTTGDKILDVPLAKVGGKGLFVKEIEQALIDGTIDLAVHSMKDVPTEQMEGLILGAIMEREDPRDVLISNNKLKLNQLPHNSLIGTSSLRRQCQLLQISPGTKIVQLRGNLDTRIRKLREEKLTAIIVAAAGVHRLGLKELIADYLAPQQFLPAIGQGAIGIETQSNNYKILDLIQPLNHPETQIAVSAERSFLKKLEGGCQVPIAAFAKVSNGKVSIEGLVGSIDGKKIIKDFTDGKIEEAEELGFILADKLISLGAKDILKEVIG